MASSSCLILIRFSLPLSPPNSFTKKVQLRRANAASRSYESKCVSRAMNLRVAGSRKRDVLSANRRCGSMRAPTDHFVQLVSCFRNVSYCNSKLMTGYWVGPDSDDGWGYVEAFVNRIS